jgi:ribosomal protein S18 acetylase RimI-like enzyme
VDEWVIRPPRLEDAQAIGTLHARIWQHAYRGLLKDELLDALDVDARIRRWRAVAERIDARGVDDDGHRAMAAFVAGAPVGMIQAAPSDPAANVAEAELLSLNVAPEWHGTGVAGALIKTVLPDGAASLWVLTGNTRAIAFYQKHGFELAGTARYDPTWDCTDLRMWRPPS